MKRIAIGAPEALMNILQRAGLKQNWSVGPWIPIWPQLKIWPKIFPSVPQADVRRIGLALWSQKLMGLPLVGGMELQSITQEMIFAIHIGMALISN